MILNGPRLAIRPARSWSAAVGDRPRPTSFLLVGALTAAIWPAAAVVGGQLGAAALGLVNRETAVERALVGLVAGAGGALVMAPALALVLIRLVRASRAEHGEGLEIPAALGILWPAWTAGLVMAPAPLAGLGPELGEIAWMLLAVLLAVRAVTAGAVPGLGVRRRWRRHFVARVSIAFLLLFLAIPIAPALGVRALLGVEGEMPRAAPEPPSWPLPPEPSW